MKRTVHMQSKDVCLWLEVLPSQAAQGALVALEMLKVKSGAGEKTDGNSNRKPKLNASSAKMETIT